MSVGELSMDAYAQRVVEEAPPLTDEQWRRIRALLWPTGEAASLSESSDEPPP